MEDAKKTPEEEKKPEAPVTEKKETPTTEEKPADEKQAEENGKGSGKPDKPDESVEEEKKDEKPEEKGDEPEPAPEAPATPDAKDEEILRLKTQIAAMSLGVKPDCMDDAVAIAESYVKSGKNEDINSALAAVVKKYPDMKGDGKDSGKKSGGFKVGADSSDSKKADDEKLSQAFGIKKKKC